MEHFSEHDAGVCGAMGVALLTRGSLIVRLSAFETDRSKHKGCYKLAVYIVGDDIFLACDSAGNVRLHNDYSAKLVWNNQLLRSTLNFSHLGLSIVSWASVVKLKFGVVN